MGSSSGSAPTFLPQFHTWQVARRGPSERLPARAGSTVAQNGSCSATETETMKGRRCVPTNYTN
jgi:hypothetical protein